MKYGLRTFSKTLQPIVAAQFLEPQPSLKYLKYIVEVTDVVVV